MARGPRAMVGLLLALPVAQAAQGSEASYVEHEGRNAYTGYGAINLDSDSAPEGLTASQCQDRCTEDASCQCVTFGGSTAKCWKRQACIAAGWRVDPEYTVYMKASAKPASVAGDDYGSGLGKRCGGEGWTGSTKCAEGLFCNGTNEFWRDCQVGEAPQEPMASSSAGFVSSAGMPPSLDEINARFAAGGAGNDLDAAGVLIHQFHNGGDGDWKPWTPCPETCFGGPCWCHTFADRFSATVVNAKTMDPAKGEIGMYSPDNPGFILAPWAMQVNCAYPADGGSESKSCKPGEAGCVPGCGTKWCQYDPAMPNNMDTSCAWPANELQRVLSLQELAHSKYNEVVVDAASWVDHLPGSVQAVFYVKGSKGEEEARKVHQSFVSEFAESSLAARSALLLEMDVKNPQAPFRDVTDTHFLRRFNEESVAGVRHRIPPLMPLACLACVLVVAGPLRRTVRKHLQRRQLQREALLQESQQDAELLQVGLVKEEEDGL